jgi:hypothetical protein
MDTQLEEFIVKKYGEEQSAIIFTLAANLYNFSSSLSKTFGMSAEEQMVLLGYAYNMGREQFKESQKNDFNELINKLAKSEESGESEVGDLDEDDGEDEQEDLDFLK